MAGSSTARVRPPAAGRQWPSISRPVGTASRTRRSSAACLSVVGWSGPALIAGSAPPRRRSAPGPRPGPDRRGAGPGADAADPSTDRAGPRYDPVAGAPGRTGPARRGHARDWCSSATSLSICWAISASFMSGSYPRLCPLSQTQPRWSWHNAAPYGVISLCNEADALPLSRSTRPLPRRGGQLSAAHQGRRDAARPDHPGGPGRPGHARARRAADRQAAPRAAAAGRRGRRRHHRVHQRQPAASRFRGPEVPVVRAAPR